ncbi:peptidylprolyl isomerase [Palleronia pelagia]|uniref:Parvulin-like PPIase n=1 Tax=Palleronia pelagia TaxID=387096 RepID=A0A1H8EUT5_9RHOB|nr:peptidylprolyl isomerase [Palleronia pelagia]SEN23235.1 peptidyl-prolyl cis-trans isomerase C [Palleronia pelagia]
MNRLIPIATACTLAMGAALPSHAQEADTVVATVGDTAITLGHVAAYRASLGEQVNQMPAQQLYDAVLDQLISMAVLADGREVGEVEQIFIDNERRSQLARAAVLDLQEQPVEDAEVQAAYEEMFGDFQSSPEFNASHILVETEEEAADLIAQLEDGADFATLARENSTGPSGPSGGELGWFGPGQMVPAFDQAVQEMDVNAIAGPVQTQFGWHVIKLNDARQTEAPSLDEVRDELAQQVLSERITNEIETRREAADITIAEDAVDPSVINDPSILAR